MQTAGCTNPPRPRSTNPEAASGKYSETQVNYRADRSTNAIRRARGKVQRTETQDGWNVKTTSEETETR